MIIITIPYLSGALDGGSFEIDGDAEITGVLISITGGCAVSDE
jgi:hypothetical protein